jgi:hypothetical protein
MQMRARSAFCDRLAQFNLIRAQVHNDQEFPDWPKLRVR